MELFFNESRHLNNSTFASSKSDIGAKDLVIYLPSNLIFPKELKVKKITSADEMLNEVKKLLPVDLAVCAAAVTDFKPLGKNKNKINCCRPSLPADYFIGSRGVVESVG